MGEQSLLRTSCRDHPGNIAHPSVAQQGFFRIEQGAGGGSAPRAVKMPVQLVHGLLGLGEWSCTECRNRGAGSGRGEGAVT